MGMGIQKPMWFIDSCLIQLHGTVPCHPGHFTPLAHRAPPTCPRRPQVGFSLKLCNKVCARSSSMSNISATMYMTIYIIMYVSAREYYGIFGKTRCSLTEWHHSLGKDVVSDDDMSDCSGNADIDYLFEDDAPSKSTQVKSS